MSMYANILVPIDSSDESMAALNEAIRLAKQRQSTLRLLHVVKLPAPIYDYAYGETIALDRLTDSVCQIGSRLLDRAEAIVCEHGLVPECVMCESNDGSAANAILAQARQWQANLIVMGSHARRTGVPVSQETAAVLAESPVPVLLVRGATPQVKVDIKQSTAPRPLSVE
jgi:nucleotide-binding universal stress UspA family protein